MSEAKTKRDGVRAKARGRRAEIRKAAKENRAVLRVALRSCGKCAGLILAVVTLAMAFGCNTATPASKSASTKACDNVTTVNNNFGFLVMPSNGVPVIAGLAGGVTVQVSDLNGTIAQSADTAGGDRTDLTATPSMAAGITGDKPVEAIQKAVAAFASPQDAMSATLESLVKKFGFGAATNAVVEAGKACADGSCSDK